MSSAHHLFAFFSILIYSMYHYLTREHSYVPLSIAFMHLTRVICCILCIVSMITLAIEGSELNRTSWTQCVRILLAHLDLDIPMHAVSRHS